LLIVSCSYLLRMRYVSDKSGKKIKTHILCANTFFLKIVPLMR
jgi:hypothetical protein